MAGTDLKVTRRKLTDYVPDPRNANKGTERGQYMVDSSVEQVGAGRSLVATADGVIAAGNKTMQALVDAGILDVVEVETDGRTAVVVKRADWAGIDDEQARKYAYFDNRTSEVGLEWDIEQLIADIDAGLDLSALFLDWELERMQLAPESQEDYAEMWRGMPEFESEDLTPDSSLYIHFATPKARKTFAELIGQKITENTKSIWYPEAEIRRFMDKRYVEES